MKRLMAPAEPSRYFSLFSLSISPASHYRRAPLRCELLRRLRRFSAAYASCLSADSAATRFFIIAGACMTPPPGCQSWLALRDAASDASMMRAAASWQMTPRRQPEAAMPGGLIAAAATPHISRRHAILRRRQADY
jgi:hypothetical protein